MERVKVKVEAEIDKKQSSAGQKRPASDEKPSIARRRRARSRQKGESGTIPLPPSPTAMSLTTSTNTTLPIPTSGGAAGSPISPFTPVGVNGTPSLASQSQTGSSPGGPESVYPLSMGQGIFIPFGNSPPLFPVIGQHQQMQLAAEMPDVTRENDGSGQFWQSGFGPSGVPFPPPQYPQTIAYPAMIPVQQENLSSGGTTVEFRDPNGVQIDMGVDPEGINLDDIDNGLMDWGDFIAQCSQVWVTE
jgi:hypothetical protein